MRIVILTQYYPPETGAPQNRLSDLARRLHAFGHDVAVLTALPNYPGDEVYPAYLGRENTVDELEGIRVARVGLYVPRRKTFARRILNYLTFAANALRHGRRLVTGADVLLMESPPLFLGLAAVPLARRFGATLVTNVSDLWPRSALELGIIGPGFTLRSAERLEAWLYRHSRLITGQTRGIVSDIQRRFPAADVILFPNGVDLAAYEGEFDRDAIRREFRWSPETFVVGYTGVLGHAQALDQVLDAAPHLRDRGDIHIALFGDGPCRDAIASRLAKERLRPVSLYPRQAATRLPGILAALDAGLVPLANKPLFEGARPSKMFEIMAAGKPVILCARGEAAAVLTTGGGTPAGIICPPEAPAALAAAIVRLSSSADLAQEMGCAGRRIVKSHFDREIIARQFEAALLRAVPASVLPTSVPSRTPVA